MPTGQKVALPEIMSQELVTLVGKELNMDQQSVSAPVRKALELAVNAGLLQKIRKRYTPNRGGLTNAPVDKKCKKKKIRMPCCPARKKRSKRSRSRKRRRSGRSRSRGRGKKRCGGKSKKRRSRKCRSRRRKC